MKLLNLLDDFNREGLGIELAFSLPVERDMRLQLNRKSETEAPIAEGRLSSDLHRPGWQSDHSQ